MTSLPNQMEVQTRTLKKFDYGLSDQSRFYFLNSIKMMDAPGEYLIDHATSHLYFIPPDNLGGNVLRGAAFISVSNSSFVVKDVAKLTFRGILFGFTKDTAVSAQNVSDFHFLNCTIGNSGSNGIFLQATNSSVRLIHINSFLGNPFIHC